MKRLRKKLPAPNGINALAKPMGLGNSAFSALEAGEGNPELKTLYALAIKFGLEPWHLFVKDVDPSNPPHLVTAEEMRWHLKVEELVKERETQVGAETGRFAPMGTPPKKAAFRRRKKR